MYGLNCSVIVCTYNRAESLRTTLGILGGQDYADGDLEILVVDNNSQDHTRQVVEHAARRSPVPVRYHFEPRQGLSRARNAGIGVARGEIIAFIDDDAYPRGADWAYRLASTFEDPTVGAAGGDAEPIWPDRGRPDWLHNRLLNYLGVVRFSYGTVTDLKYPHFPYGVNISFRRELLETIGGFLESAGRQGDVLLSGEEIELCRRVCEAGRRVVYVPGAAVHHVMAPGRLTREWFLRRARFQGVTKAHLEARAWVVPRLLKRGMVLGASIAATPVLRLSHAEGLAMVARCKAAMSWAYLKTSVGACPGAGPTSAR